MTEKEIIERAQYAVSESNWILGECASAWTIAYAKGRTDSDFANLVGGVSGDMIQKCRTVWNEFHEVKSQYSDALTWSFFLVALTWDDATECLNWADENQASISEMKAWRRGQHGEDVSKDAEPEVPNRFGTSDKAPPPKAESKKSAAIKPADDDYAPYRNAATKPRNADDENDVNAQRCLTRLVIATRELWRLDGGRYRNVLRDQLNALADEATGDAEPSGLDKRTIRGSVGRRAS